MDDVLNVSGHRIGTAEVTAAVVQRTCRQVLRGWRCLDTPTFGSIISPVLLLCATLPRARGHRRHWYTAVVDVDMGVGVLVYGNDKPVVHPVGWVLHDA